METTPTLCLRDELIREIQRSVPFEPQPFEKIGERLECCEEEVLKELRSLKEEGVLREISAVLEGSLLGYDSALVCGSVRPSNLEQAVKVVNAHPTVTHNYLRGHTYNLWFTIAVPESMPLEQTLALLAKESGVENFHPLRRTHTFKIGVNFDPKTLTNNTTTVVDQHARPEAIAVDSSMMQKFRLLQTPLPLESRPFKALGERVGVGEEDLLRFAKSHLGGGVRRYVGTLRHRKLGVESPRKWNDYLERPFRGDCGSGGETGLGTGSQSLLRQKWGGGVSLHRLQHGSRSQQGKLPGNRELAITENRSRRLRSPVQRKGIQEAAVTLFSAGIESVVESANRLIDGLGGSLVVQCWTPNRPLPLNHLDQRSDHKRHHRHELQEDV